MNYNLIDEYVDLHGNTIVICDFHPSISDMIPKVRDQWQPRLGGWVRVWMERGQLETFIQRAAVLEMDDTAYAEWLAEHGFAKEYA